VRKYLGVYKEDGKECVMLMEASDRAAAEQLLQMLVDVQDYEIISEREDRFKQLFPKYWEKHLEG
jgi:hypothetical protein